MSYHGIFSKDRESELCDTCLRNPHYLVFHKKAVSRIVAGLLLCSFFIFVTGYFLGKKHVAHDFSALVERTSFSDQINFALNALYDKEAQDPQSFDKVTQEQREAPVITESITQQPRISEEPAPHINNQKKYVAQLLGGTYKSITDFSDRLHKRGITVDVKKRVSKTAKGKTIQWYQAITQPYDNQEDLLALVAHIKKLEKINEVPIIQIST